MARNTFGMGSNQIQSHPHEGVDRVETGPESTQGTPHESHRPIAHGHANGFSEQFLQSSKGRETVIKNEAGRDPIFESSVVRRGEQQAKVLLTAFNLKMRQTNGTARPEIGANGKPWA